MLCIAYFNYGSCQEFLGDFSGCLISYEKALSVCQQQLGKKHSLIKTLTQAKYQAQQKLKQHAKKQPTRLLNPLTSTTSVSSVRPSPRSLQRLLPPSQSNLLLGLNSSPSQSILNHHVTNQSQQQSQQQQQQLFQSSPSNHQLHQYNQHENFKQHDDLTHSDNTSHREHQSEDTNSLHNASRAVREKATKVEPAIVAMIHQHSTQHLIAQQ